MMRASYEAYAGAYVEAVDNSASRLFDLTDATRVSRLLHRGSHRSGIELGDREGRSTAGMQRFLLELDLVELPAPRYTASMTPQWRDLNHDLGHLTGLAVQKIGVLRNKIIHRNAFAT